MSSLVLESAQAVQASQFARLRVVPFVFLKFCRELATSHAGLSRNVRRWSSLQFKPRTHDFSAANYALHGSAALAAGTRVRRGAAKNLVGAPSANLNCRAAVQLGAGRFRRSVGGLYLYLPQGLLRLSLCRCLSACRDDAPAAAHA